MSGLNTIAWIDGELLAVLAGLVSPPRARESRRAAVAVILMQRSGGSEMTSCGPSPRDVVRVDQPNRWAREIIDQVGRYQPVAEESQERLLMREIVESGLGVPALDRLVRIIRPVSKR